MTEYPAPISYIGEVKVNSTNPNASGFYTELNQAQFNNGNKILLHKMSFQILITMMIYFYFVF